MARSAHRRLSAAALVAAVTATPAVSGSAPPTHWAAPVSGDFFDPANWLGGVLPSLHTPALIDATGSPYTVDLITNAPVLPIALTIDSQDATVLYSGNTFPTAYPTPTAALDVRRGELVLAARTGSRNLAPITVFDDARIRMLGVGSGTSSYQPIRLGRDLALHGQAIFEGAAVLGMLSDPFFNGFPTPNFSISDTGRAEFAGGNIILGGVITNMGTMRFENDPSFDRPGGIDAFVGARIGSERDNDRGYPTTFLNNGLVIVEQGDLTLGAFGSHSGEFHLASGSRLVLEEVQHFMPSSRITGNGVVFAETADRLSGAVHIDGDLEVQRSGAVAASLTVGGNIDIFNNYPGSSEFDVSGPVEIGGAITANGAALIFRSAFDGAITSPNSGGTNARARTAEFFGAARIRGDLYTHEGATFHQLAIVDGNVAGATFMQSAIIGGHAEGIALDHGGTIGGNLSGTVTIQGTTTVGGDFIQASATRSALTQRYSGERLIVHGDVDIRSPFFVSSMSIVADGDFRAMAGVLSSITADTVTFGGSGAIGSGIVSLYRSSRITSKSNPTLIDRARVSVYQDYAGATGEVSFLDGFTITYIPISAATRSGFNARINLDTDRNDTFYFFADSLLAGTLDIGVFGDLSLLAFGDSFTILEGQVVHGSTDPLPTITGEFDRLFLPSLPGDLYFDVVYEPSVVRLVVVPAPGAAAVLMVGALASIRRRTRRN